MYVMIGFLLVFTILSAIGTMRSKKVGNKFAMMFGAISTLAFGFTFVVAIVLRIRHWLDSKDEAVAAVGQFIQNLM